MTVKEFIEAHPEATLDMMTPGGYVYLTPEYGKQLLAGKSVAAHFGWPGIERYISPEEVLPQMICKTTIRPTDPDYYCMLTDYIREEINGCILQTAEQAGPSMPVGRIDYLGSRGQVRESVSHYDAEKFVSVIKKENYYGVPMSITVYSDPSTGAHMDTSWRLDLDPLPQGFEIVPYQEEPVQQAVTEPDWEPEF